MTPVERAALEWHENHDSYYAEFERNRYEVRRHNSGETLLINGRAIFDSPTGNVNLLKDVAAVLALYGHSELF